MIFALFEKKVRKMKRLLLLLALLLPAALFAQDEQSALRIPDEDDIALRTIDASSPYYYTNLMLKYRHGTAPLTPRSITTSTTATPTSRTIDRSPPIRHSNGCCR